MKSDLKESNKLYFGSDDAELVKTWLETLRQQLIIGAPVKLRLQHRTFMETVLLTMRDSFAR